MAKQVGPAACAASLLEAMGPAGERASAAGSLLISDLVDLFRVVVSETPIPGDHFRSLLPQ